MYHIPGLAFVEHWFWKNVHIFGNSICRSALGMEVRMASRYLQQTCMGRDSVLIVATVAICIYVSLSLSLYIYMLIHNYMGIYIYIYIYLFVYIYICVYSLESKCIRIEGKFFFRGLGIQLPSQSVNL